MEIIEKTKDGIWYQSSDGSESYLTNQEANMMLEMLSPKESWDHGGINE